MSRAYEPPKFRRMLGRSLTIGCPACGQRRLFRRWVIMTEDCPRCGLHFERIEGHWIGAIGINTIVSFGVLLITMIVGLIASAPDIQVVPLTLLCVSVAALFPILFYPFSKTVWTAIDIGMRPLEPHEVDWTKLETTATQEEPEAPLG